MTADMMQMSTHIAQSSTATDVQAAQDAANATGKRYVGKHSRRASKPGILRRVFATRAARKDEQGYVAVITVLLFTAIFGMCAFAVDVGNWYVTGQEEQRAADAAALAGVTNLPGNKTAAFTSAQAFAAANGFTNGQSTVSVVPGIDGTPTRLRVTVTKTVDNAFGGIFGLDKTTITRTAVADFAGPVPLGSPCNEFGNDPDSLGIKSSTCADTGQFWANVGSPAAAKVSGDAFQNNTCATGVDGCTGSVNTDYDPNGYFYTVTLTRPVSNLTLQAFDPALIDVGDTCTSANLTGAAALVPIVQTPTLDALTRYATGPASPYCTGDIRFGGTGQVSTKFTIRDPGPNPWDPTSYPVDSSCPAKIYPGFSGNIADALNITKPLKYDANVATTFRKWNTLCVIPYAAAGTYMIQVNTNGLGLDAASGHNRFALRAYSTTDSSAKDAITLAGYNKMAMYANLPGANTLFYLARVPSGSAGQILNVRLFDIGDSSQPGTIQVVAPADSHTSFTNCTGSGPTVGNLPTCSITANSSYNGKWQTISVPIPSGYSCDDTSTTGCWVKLRYNYGTGAQPSDTTSWTASIEGDPVRLVE